MMRTRSKLSALVAGLAGMLALSGCGSIYDVPLPGGPDVGSKPYQVHVMFRDVLDLVPQSTVKVDDVTVGKVKAVKLHGYVADVTVELPDKVKLPDNAEAEIRQTSLLGEKFVSLKPPESPGSGRLGNGDVIPLSRTGRNVEVEEVFSALALLLNGGGVGQLKTIAQELNTAIGGREEDFRSVLDQIHAFTGQLATNKVAIVNALENVNRLSVQLRKQEGTVKSALDNLPAAIRSVNSQRKSLVQTLQALSKLSSVGVQVIAQSKASTISTLQDLSPVLTQFAKAGQDLPDSLQVLLTYPFLDAAVGNDPQVARNLHIGDYTNLSVRLDIGLSLLDQITGGKLATTCLTAKQQAQTLGQSLGSLVDQGALGTVLQGLDCRQLTADPKTVLSGALGLLNLDATTVTQVCAKVALPGLCPGVPLAKTALLSGSPLTAQKPLLGNNPLLGDNGLLGKKGSGSSGSGGSGTSPNLFQNLGGLLGLGRPATGTAYQDSRRQQDPLGLAPYGFDPGIGTLLLQGVAATS